LGSLRVAPLRVMLGPTGGGVSIRWAQTHPARVKVTIETPEGIVVRTVSSSTLAVGTQAGSWDGLGPGREPVGRGPYVVRGAATNELGGVSLTRRIVVRRVKR